MDTTDASPLPYRDTKPQGSADFYFAINATFRFLIERRGIPGWIAYLKDLATDYYRPVWLEWKSGGLKSVAQYIQAAFQAEPGAVFKLSEARETLVLEVIACSAIRHLRLSNREIVPEFCQHCYFQYSTIAKLAGLHMRLQGGNRRCTQTFSSKPLQQNTGDISTVQ